LVTTGANPNYNAAGTRMMWIPDQAAFRGGTLTTDADAWDATNVGDHSFAFGEDCVASGNESIAMGDACLASGQGSVAMGESSQASDVGAVAMGDECIASGHDAFAAGEQNVATGQASTALEHTNSVDGEGSFADSFGNQTTNTGATAHTPQTWGYIIGGVERNFWTSIRIPWVYQCGFIFRISCYWFPFELRRK
jgi:hypothetical protein